MRLLETMPDMTVIDRHQLVGAIVRDEIARSGLTKVEAAAQMRMGRATLYRLMAGEEVDGVQHARAERVLNMPRGLLTHVADGDAAWISAAPMDEDFRRYILEALDSVSAPKKRGARQGSRRGA